MKSALTFVDFGIVVDNSSFETPLRFVAATARGKTQKGLPDGLKIDVDGTPFGCYLTRVA